MGLRLSVWVLWGKQVERLAMLSPGLPSRLHPPVPPQRATSHVSQLSTWRACSLFRAGQVGEGGWDGWGEGVVAQVPATQPHVSRIDRPTTQPTMWAHREVRLGRLASAAGMAPLNPLWLRSTSSKLNT